MNVLEFRNLPMVTMIPFLCYVMHTLVDRVMVDDSVVKFMKSKEKYDVCVVEVFNMEAIMVIISFYIGTGHTSLKKFLYISSSSSYYL